MASARRRARRPARERACFAPRRTPVRRVGAAAGRGTGRARGGAGPPLLPGVTATAMPCALAQTPNADPARMRFLAKRVAGGAPITSLCAWLGLRLRGRNLRPGVKGYRDFPVGGQPISLWADRLCPCRRSADLPEAGRRR
jgi:hypothetical protein